MCPENCETGSGYFRQSLVTSISDDIEQFFNTIAADRGDNSEFGKMSAYRIDHRDLLTHAQMTRSMKHHAALLLGSLGRHEPHIGSGDCLANGLCVSRIILLPLDVGLHVGRWYQPHIMAERLELARPMVRRSASFDADKGWSTFWKNART